MEQKKVTKEQRAQFHEALQERMEQRERELEARALEAIGDMLDQFVDPLERLYDFDTGEWWQPVSSPGTPVNSSPGRGAIGYYSLNTESDLCGMRDIARTLELENEFAQNILINRMNYVVGKSGIGYLAVPKKDPDLSDGVDEALEKRKKKAAAKANEIIKEFRKREKYGKMEREKVKREDRDGEWFVRRFLDATGKPTLRVVEPEEVYTPRDKIDRKDIQFGVQFDPKDKQLILGYWVNDEFVDAEEMIHCKANVDMNVRRGVSTFWSIRKNLSRAAKIQRNMSTVAAVQSAIVGIRKFQNSSEKKVREFVDKKSNVQYDPSFTTTGGLNFRYSPKNIRAEKWRPGTMLNMPMGQDFEFTSKGINAPSFTMILDSELRAICARVVMPEFMVTSNASNNNYASILIAEGPSHKNFQGWQENYSEYGICDMEWVLQIEIDKGELDSDFWELCDLQATSPTLIVKDTLKEANANKIKKEAGVLSVQTWCAQDGLDYEQEQQNNADHYALMASYAENPMPEEEMGMDDEPDEGSDKPSDAPSRNGNQDKPVETQQGS